MNVGEGREKGKVKRRHSNQLKRTDTRGCGWTFHPSMDPFSSSCIFLLSDTSSPVSRLILTLLQHLRHILLHRQKGTQRHVNITSSQVSFFVVDQHSLHLCSHCTYLVVIWVSPESNDLFNEWWVVSKGLVCFPFWWFPLDWQKIGLSLSMVSLDLLRKKWSRCHLSYLFAGVNNSQPQLCDRWTLSQQDGQMKWS